MEKCMVNCKTALSPSLLPGLFSLPRPASSWALHWSKPTLSLQNLKHFNFYSSSIARFLRPNPIDGKPENAQSWNLYAYVGNNPVNRTDPKGLWALSFKGGKLIVNKSKTGDDAVSLARQLGFTGKSASKIVKKIIKKFGDKKGNLQKDIQLSKMGGVVGRTFRVAEKGLAEQEKYIASGGGKTAGPTDASLNDCSMTSAKIAFPTAIPTGFTEWGIQDTNKLLESRQTLSSWELQTGDVVRWGEGVKTHFANFLMMDDYGQNLVFSRSGVDGVFEIVTEVPNPVFEKFYGEITGEFRAEP